MSTALPLVEVTVPPGDPDAFRDAARTLGAAAETLDGVGRGFEHAIQVCDPGTWFGLAGAAFRVRVGDTREAVQVGSSSMREAAAACVILADRLEAAQRRARNALAVAESAAGLVVAANAALATELRSAEPDPLNQIRLRRELEYAEDDFAAARSTAADAYREAVEAARAAAAALNRASDNAKAPPSPGDADMEPTETPGQFFGRQFGDVFVDALNPFSGGNSDYKNDRLSIDWPVGLIFGGTEAISRGYARNALRYQSGYWAKLPTAVSGYVRTLPSGRKVRVAPYFRRDGVWSPGGVVIDDEQRAIFGQRARLTKATGSTLGFVLAAADQLVEDRGRRDLDGGDRAGRAAASSLAVGGLSIAGAALGGAVGTVIAPGVGTVAGGLLGGMVGAGVGEKVKGGLFRLPGMD